VRPAVLFADSLRQFLHRNRVATLPQLKLVLGTQADITVFFKLKELSYCASYSHRNSFYPPEEVADFDQRDRYPFHQSASLDLTGRKCRTLAIQRGFLAERIE
jgi:hypothetical protein